MTTLSIMDVDGDVLEIDDPHETAATRGAIVTIILKWPEDAQSHRDPSAGIDSDDVVTGETQVALDVDAAERVWADLGERIQKARATRAA